MRTAILTRMQSSDEGTFGQFVTDSGFKCFTGELPWRDNEPNKSCVPPGTYMVIMAYSPRHGSCYHLQEVPGRTDIEIHGANFVGDSDKGLKCELLGCISPGMSIGELEGQKAILNSGEALSLLENDLQNQIFQLTIQNDG